MKRKRLSCLPFFEGERVEFLREKLRERVEFLREKLREREGEVEEELSKEKGCSCLFLDEEWTGIETFVFFLLFFLFPPLLSFFFFFPFSFFFLLLRERERERKDLERKTWREKL